MNLVSRNIHLSLWHQFLKSIKSISQRQDIKVVDLVSATEIPSKQKNQQDIADEIKANKTSSIQMRKTQQEATR